MEHREPHCPDRAALMRDATQLLGARQLAAQLGISESSLYQMAAGKRRVLPGVLADTLEALRVRRWALGRHISHMRSVVAGERGEGKR